MKGMDNYCDHLAAELGGWKTKLHAVVIRIDRVSSGEKERVIDQARDLHMITEELENRIEGLRQECPTEWGPGDIEMKARLTEIYIAY
jgi:hypothetical protein